MNSDSSPTQSQSEMPIPFFFGFVSGNGEGYPFWYSFAGIEVTLSSSLATSMFVSVLTLFENRERNVVPD